MDAKLVVVVGDAQVRQYDVHLPAVIGRSRRNDLTLGNPLVSRQHCEVFEANGTLMIRDLGSLNGTYVGDTRIDEQAMPLKPGDLFSVGPVTFRAVYGDNPPHIAVKPWDTGGSTLNGPKILSEQSTLRPPRRALGGHADDVPDGT